MIHDILFRAKKLTGQWVYGYLYITHTGEYEIGSYNKELDIERWTAVVDPATVGQYTGLTDKNGVKIFEGDVVEGYDFDREDGYGFVRWRCGAFEVVRDGFFGTFLENYLGMAFKVIGNIHDNPELLEENPQ